MSYTGFSKASIMDSTKMQHIFVVGFYVRGVIFTKPHLKIIDTLENLLHAECVAIILKFQLLRI
jgi:hypothetical protein